MPRENLEEKLKRLQKEEIEHGWRYSYARYAKLENQVDNLKMKIDKMKRRAKTE